MHVADTPRRDSLRPRRTSSQPFDSFGVRSLGRVETDEPRLVATMYTGKPITDFGIATVIARIVSLSFHESLRLSFHITGKVPVSLFIRVSLSNLKLAEDSLGGGDL